MDYEMEIEVFRAGDYGARGAWSEADLDRIVADYSPQVHEAPVTLDHSQNGPALGWVRALRRVGQALVARLGGLDAEFLKRLKDGAFKKRSVELYRQAPGTGRPYLRALTFLGAAAPAVKGLADPVFSENEPMEPIEFRGDERSVPLASQKSGDIAFALEEPVKTFEETPSTLNENPLKAEAAGPGTSPSLPVREIPESVHAFCDRLRREGRLLPGWEAQGLRVFLAALDATEPLAFTEETAGAESVPRTCRAWFQEFLEALAPLVPLGEAVPTPSAESDLPAGWSNFADPGPSAACFDPTSVSLHQRVCRFRHTHPHLSYSEALCVVAAF